jgi:hypothetical protein
MHQTLVDAGCAVVPFVWTGGNSHRARHRAAGDLAEQLRVQAEKTPEAQQWIVAHSHGGNVALNAAARLRGDGEAKGNVYGIATLATPFIHAYLRPVPATWRSVPFMFIYNISFALAIPQLAGGVAEPALTYSTVALAALVGVAFAMGALMHRASKEEVVQRIHASDVRPDEFLAVRTPGDEASILIASGQLLSVVSTRISRILASAIPFLVVIALTLVAFIIELVNPQALGLLAFHNISTLAALLLVSGAVVTIIPACVVFGLDGGYVAAHALVSAEAAPPGKCEVLQLPADEWLNFGKWPMFHSAICNNQIVIDSIVQRITGRNVGGADSSPRREWPG